MKRVSYFAVMAALSPAAMTIFPAVTAHAASLSVTNPVHRQRFDI
jgi:hypothetical protein